MDVKPRTHAPGRLVTCCLVALGICTVPSVHAEGQLTVAAIPSTPELVSLETAQRSFYSGRYAEAADLALEPCASGAGDAAACELRTSALLLQIKRALKDQRDKRTALKNCSACPALLSAFQTATTRGQAVVRAQLQADPDHQTALFLLAKLNLNHVWLQLGTLGRRTGWHEYKEARHLLDQVLEQNPRYVRARVARAWIDYIVATKMPRGTRWILGGGNKKRGLLAVREAATADAGFFERTEALFALWDMQVRENRLPDALVTARRLVLDFPDNEELRSFIETHQTALASN